MLLYTDGLRLLTVSQRPAHGEAEAAGGKTAATRGGEQVVRYRSGDRIVLVVGNLDEDELLRVAKSVP